MIKVIAVLHNRRTLILGLDRVNTQRIHADQPIVLDLQALVQSIGHGLDGPVQDIIVIGGETLEDVYTQLHEVLPTLPPFAEMKEEES